MEARAIFDKRDVTIGSSEVTVELGRNSIPALAERGQYRFRAAGAGGTGEREA